MKKIAFFQCLIFIFSILGCGGHNDPPPPCSSATVCAHLDYINSAGLCCNGSLKTVVTNDHPSRTVIVAVLEDTLLGNVWLFDNNVQLFYVPKQSSVEIGCGFRIDRKLERCVVYKRWRIGTACFEGDTKCTVTLPNNNDLPKMNCLRSCLNGQSTCTSIDTKNIPDNNQKIAIQQLYKDLLGSQTTARINDNDILNALFQIQKPGSRQTIITPTEFQCTGTSLHIQPLLWSPAPFPGSTETYTKLWIDCPNVISGQITRDLTQTDVAFTTSRPEFITVQVELEPSKTIRTDVIKHLYVLPKEHSLVIGGDFLCIRITGLD